MNRLVGQRCHGYVTDVFYLLITIVAFALLAMLVGLLDRGGDA